MNCNWKMCLFCLSMMSSTKLLSSSKVRRSKFPLTIRLMQLWLITKTNCLWLIKSLIKIKFSSSFRPKSFHGEIWNWYFDFTSRHTSVGRCLVFRAHELLEMFSVSIKKHSCKLLVIKAMTQLVGNNTTSISITKQKCRDKNRWRQIPLSSLV